MATVSSLVVKRRLASMRQVEDALARQTLYGGDVVTNLLEVAPPPATDEAALTAALADALELAAAPLESLRTPDPTAVARMPKALAEQNGFVPIAMRDGAVVIALAEPLVAATVDELAAMIGAPLVQTAAPIVRLRQALERAYGVPMDRRTRRLAAILDGKTGSTDAGAPSRRTSIPDVADDPVAGRVAQKTAPSGMMVKPPAAPSEPRREAAPPTPTPPPVEAQGPESSRTPPPTTIRPAQPSPNAAAAAGGLQWFVRNARGEAAASAPGRRRRGPYTRADAEKVFGDPASTDAVLAAVLEFAQQYFAYVAMFLVQEDVAEGWDAIGAGASGDRVRKMGVPLDLPSILASAREGRAPLVRPRPTDGLDAVVAIDLERPKGGDVVVAPVVVGKRVVALLYGDDGGSSIVASDISEVFAIVAAAGTALARMIVRKKQKTAPVAAVPVPVKPTSQRPERRVDPDTLAERAGVLAKAFSGRTSSRPPPAVAEAKPETPPEPRAADAGTSSEKKRVDTIPYREPAPAVKPASLDRIVSPASTDTAGRRQPTNPMGQLETPTPTPARETTPEESGVKLARITQPIPALRDLEDDDSAVTMRLPSHRPEAASGPISEPPPARPPSTPARALLLAPAVPTPPPPHLTGRRALGPIIPREDDEPEDGDGEDDEGDVDVDVESAEVSDAEVQDLLVLADRSGAPSSREPPARESERFEVYAARPPPASRRTEDHQLPKVMVAIEPEYVLLVDRVVHGGDAGERAAAELRAHGIAALPAIMDRFPGPTRCDRTLPIAQVPTAAEAGPLLGLLVELGRLALRDILARLGDPIAETRFWAAWLLTDIVDPESAGPLVPRLVDDDACVRRAAGIAARCLLDHRPDAAEALVEPLTGVLLDPGAPIPLRVRAAHALGDLREQRAVEGLILGLEAREPEIVAAVGDALVAITRQNPLSRKESWSSWFAKHGQKSRIEWLIDALLEDDASLREAAALELKEKTKVYFGYYANLPLPERVLAHRRYQGWWRDEGHKLFAPR